MACKHTHIWNRERAREEPNYFDGAISGERMSIILYIRAHVFQAATRPIVSQEHRVSGKKLKRGWKKLEKERERDVYVFDRHFRWFVNDRVAQLQHIPFSLSPGPPPPLCVVVVCVFLFISREQASIFPCIKTKP